jgi:hypothetical protein
MDRIWKKWGGNLRESRPSHRGAAGMFSAAESHWRLASHQAIQRPSFVANQSDAHAKPPIDATTAARMMRPSRIYAASAWEGRLSKSTPSLFASFATPSIRQEGIFDPFQLDTVDGVSFRARATATVPPSASMMSAAFCMAHSYDNRNNIASG